VRLLHRHQREERLVDLIPVVNVVLLLCLFFLLSWSFVRQPGIEVRLPSTSFSSASPQGRHVITLKSTAKETQMFFDEERVHENGLRTSLKMASGGKPTGDWITLNVDESVSHGEVQRVAAFAIENGFFVTIATQHIPPYAAGKFP